MHPRLWLVGAATGVAVVLPSAPAIAAPIAVSTTADVIANDGKCSLREAITAANKDTASGAAAGECPAGNGTDLITLPAGHYSIGISGGREDANATGDFDVTHDLTIQGAGAGATTIDGAHLDRVLDIHNVITVTVTGVTVSGGRAPGTQVPEAPEDGGGIRNAGTLSVDHSVITDNRAGAGGTFFLGGGDKGGDGGGIYGGTVTLTSTSVTGNFAGDGGPGTALTGATGAAATGDAAGVGGSGGGVWSDAQVTVTNSTISGNSAGKGGKGGDGTGGAGGSGTGSPGPSGGSGTGAEGGAGGDGGGVEAKTLTAAGSTIAGNNGGAGGAGGAGQGGAGGTGGTNSGGGAGGSGTGGKGGSGGRGGGVYAPFGGSVVNTTLDANGSGSGGSGGPGTGGAGGPGKGICCIGGQGGDGAGGDGADAGDGGGISSGDLTVAHATISSNSAHPFGAGGAGTGGAAGIPGLRKGSGTPGGAGSVAIGGGVRTNNGSATLTNTIVAQNSPYNCAGTTTDGGHDLSFPATDTTCAGGHGDPLLGPLEDNGGPTATMALAPGSAALDQVPATGASCAMTDQRGVTRPKGPLCDIGAFERALPIATTGAASAIAPTTAHVAGTLNPQQRPTSYRFEYGKTKAYGSHSVVRSAGAGATDVVAAATLTGLAPNTTYHYRLRASNGDGTSAGADRSFKTARACVVPKLKGKKLGAAKKALRAADCKLGKVKRKQSNRKPGRVISQKPKPGTLLPPGSTVALVVSKH